MIKFFVKLGLRALNVLGLVALARLIVTKMTANANFPTPDPPLPVISAATLKLERSAQDVAAAKTTLAEKVVIQNQDETI